MEGINLGFLEVLDRSGNVAERVRITQLPLCIGRAYDNDLIIADPYMCPHHARLELDESGQLCVCDLDSVNGLYGAGDNQRMQAGPLISGADIRLGHTRVRFRSMDYDIAPTLQDHHARQFLGIYENRAAQLGIFIITMGALWSRSFFDTVERRDASEPAFDLIVPVFFIVFWAGTWAFAGRVIAHRIKFLAHCAVICVALLTVFVYDTGFEYLAFALSADDFRTAFSVLGGLAIVGVAFYSHLRFATLASRLRLGVFASAISVAIVGLVALKLHVDNSQFSPVPQSLPTLKAPMFQVVEAESSDKFFTRLSDLRDEVIQQMEEEK